MRLEPTAAVQTVGRPRRLGVNHAVDTAGWLVVVGRSEDVTWPLLEETMRDWSDLDVDEGTLRVPAALEAGWEVVVVRPFVVMGP